MIAFLLDLHPFVQTAIVVGALFVVGVLGLLVWAYWWPLGEIDCQCECCGDEPRVPPFYGDDR